MLTRPADEALDSFDFQFGPQFYLLPVHTFREDDGRLAELARIRLARIEISS